MRNLNYFLWQVSKSIARRRDTPHSARPEPKAKDAWEKLDITAKAVAALVIGGASVTFTYLYNDRSNQIQEIDVVAKLIPLLGSEDPGVKLAAYNAIGVLGGNDLLAQLAERDPGPITAKAVIAAAESPTVTSDEKTRLEQALGNILSIAPAQIAAFVSAQNTSRTITEVHLHHTGLPSAADYKGQESINKIVSVYVSRLSRSATHFIVSPDGLVWMGLSVENTPLSISRRNRNAISITLFLNGDNETIGTDQMKSLMALFHSIDEKFSLKHGGFF